MKVLVHDHPDTSSSYNLMGNVLCANDDQGNAHQIRLKVFGLDHPDTAHTYNNVGNMYLEKGDYDSALNEHKKALKILSDVCELDHPDIVTDPVL